MKLKISNLGPIDSMVIDMSKPFILFAGDNGTGKTYAATFLYTLILDMVIVLSFPNFQFENKELPITKRLKSGVNGSLSADELFSLLKDYLKRRQKEVLASMNLNINTDSFKCEIVTSKDEWKEELRNKSVSVWYNYIVKKANSFDYKLRWIE